MSQSEQHRNLVIQVVKALEARCPLMSIIVDVQQKPGDEVPPLINGFRPDVYARKKSDNLLIIADAKTDNDFKYQHTNDQVESFIKHLEQRKNGYFILSATGYHGANRAKTLLRFVRQTMHVTDTALAVFDGCDFWLLDPSDGVTWHLS